MVLMIDALVPSKAYRSSISNNLRLHKSCVGSLFKLQITSFWLLENNKLYRKILKKVKPKRNEIIRIII